MRSVYDRYRARSPSNFKYIFENKFITKGSFVMGVSGFNYLFQVWFEPYDQDVLNEIEKRSLICSAFTLYCALFYIQSNSLIIILIAI